MKHDRTANDREFRGAYFHHLPYDVIINGTYYCFWKQ